MMRRPNYSLLKNKAQRGAALVTGLILLMVLTLLAVAGMNSASLEFIMAGNDQYHQNAFQAAETGIQQAIATGKFVPGAKLPEVVTAQMPNAPNDAYTASIASINGAPQQMWWGSDTGVTAYHFEIGSTGTAVRSSTAVNTQGIAVIATASNSTGADNSLGTDQLK